MCDRQIVEFCYEALPFNLYFSIVMFYLLISSRAKMASVTVQPYKLNDVSSTNGLTLNQDS